MNMYHPPSKRKQLIRRIAVYSSMSVAVVLLVVALVLIMQGYRFDSQQGRLEQGGLVQFDTIPSGANVTIDGSAFGTQTPAKTTMVSGEHHIQMQRDGYQSWQKSIDVVPGSVLWLRYARLIPNDPPVNQVGQYRQVSSTVVSPNSHWLAIKESPTDAAIRLVDLSRDDARSRVITLPPSVLSQSSSNVAAKISLVEWDPSNRYIIAKYSYGNTNEWLVIDSENPGRTKNISADLGVTMQKPEFSLRSSRILFALIDNSIRRIDIDAMTLSGPLVRNVERFNVYDRATLTYVTGLDVKTKQQSVGYYTEGTERGRVLKSYANHLSPRISIGDYFGDTYVAIAHGKTLEIFEADLPASDNVSAIPLKPVEAISLPAEARYLDTKTSGRFITAQHQKSYTMYDLELKKTTTTRFESKKAQTQKLQWLDNYTLTTNDSGRAHTYEFDGANQHTLLTNVVPHTAMAIGANNRYFYAITKAGNSYQLSRVTLILQ